jgi:hypothetical protein
MFRDYRRSRYVGSDTVRCLRNSARAADTFRGTPWRAIDRYDTKTVPERMATVSLWAVLGIVLLLLGLPFLLAAAAQGYANYAWGGYLIGASAAFLFVALSQWTWERWAKSDPDDEALFDSA